MTATDDSIYSSHREALLEHLFVADVLRALWLRGIRRVGVLKPQVDDGYDVVFDLGGIVRHVQLKSSAVGGKTARQTVSLNLADKPSGCVVWVQFEPETLKLGPFWWLGDAPGKPLPNIRDFEVAKHAKGNAEGIKLERPNQRVVPRARFTPVTSVDEIVALLFGAASMQPSAPTITLAR